MLLLRFTADDAHLDEPETQRTMRLEPEGQSIAVCRKPSKHEGALSLFVTDGRASRVHMIFSAAEDGWGVQDNGSTNGTYVNGTRLVAHTWQHIQAGDVVNVGRGSALRWEVEENPEAAEVAHTPAAPEAAPPVEAPGTAPGDDSAVDEDAPDNGGGGDGGTPSKKKPKGRPPKGTNGQPKRWDGELGRWQADDEAAAEDAAHAAIIAKAAAAAVAKATESDLVAKAAASAIAKAAAKAAGPAEEGDGSSAASSAAERTVGGKSAAGGPAAGPSSVSAPHYLKSRGALPPVDASGRPSRWSHSLGRWVAYGTPEYVTAEASSGPSMPQHLCSDPGAAPYTLPNYDPSQHANVAAAVAAANAASSMAAGALGGGRPAAYGYGANGGGSYSAYPDCLGSASGLSGAMPMGYHPGYQPTYHRPCGMHAPVAMGAGLPSAMASALPPSLSNVSFMGVGGTGVPSMAAAYAPHLATQFGGAPAAAPPSTLPMSTSGLPPAMSHGLPTAVPTPIPNGMKTSALPTAAAVPPAAAVPLGSNPVPSGVATGTALPTGGGGGVAASGHFAPPAIPGMIQVYGMGMSESLGAVFSDLKKAHSATTLPQLRKLIDKQMGHVLRVPYPHGYLFLIRGTTSPLHLAQEKNFKVRASPHRHGPASRLRVGASVRAHPHAHAHALSLAQLKRRCSLYALRTLRLCSLLHALTRSDETPTPPPFDDASCPTYSAPTAASCCAPTSSLPPPLVPRAAPRPQCRRA